MKKLIYGVFILLLSSCTKDKYYYQSDFCTGTNFTADSFSITPLDGLQHPYAIYYTHNQGSYLLDENQIPIFKYHDKRYDHPVYYTQYAFRKLNGFYISGDSSYYHSALIIANKLLTMHDETDSSYLFPYHFDFDLHGEEDQRMHAPWHSAMTQGQVLSLFCQLYKINQDIYYKHIADKIFNSFFRIKGINPDKWISCIDKNGHIWFEEYPSELPALTLNGKVFALIGIYDYYLLTGKVEAQNLLNAGLTTLKSNIHRFRNPGNPSFYCLKHKESYPDYHQLHIRLLKSLYAMTSDPVFLSVAGEFASDF